jgi:Uma2 family endonuclease
MVVIAAKRKPKVRRVPSYLIYEELGGEALPYRGYLEVLSGKRKIEEIMGSSSLQAVLVSILNWFVANNINRKKYLIATNESGLHIDSGANLANDIAIYEKAHITLNNKYFETPPKLVIEIDIKVDLEESRWNNELEYVLAKSQKMLDFGVEKVIWISTQTKKIFVMSATERWYLVNFDEDVPLIEDCVLNLAQLLREEDIEF